MVGPGRFERPTSRLSGVRSNQLSYGPLPPPAAGRRVEAKPRPEGRFLRQESKTDPQPGRALIGRPGSKHRPGAATKAAEPGRLMFDAGREVQTAVERSPKASSIDAT